MRLYPWKRGMRVQLKPHLDRWMMGDRYGTVTKWKGLVYVKMDKSGKVLRFAPKDLDTVR